MDFDLSGEARELAAMTRDLAASGRDLWPAMAEAGVLAAALPKRSGGEGYGLPEQTAILIELGRHAASTPYLTSIVVAASALARDASPRADDQVARAARGEIVLEADPTDPWQRDRLIIGAAAYQLGVVERALEMTTEHARTRVQFGRPIGSFQAVSQRLADAYIDVEALRVALWQAVFTEARADIATAGFWAAEAGHRVLHTAVHVHGGAGLDMEYPLHRYFLAATEHEFLIGGATAQLLTLAGEL